MIHALLREFDKSDISKTLLQLGFVNQRFINYMRYADRYYELIDDHMSSSEAIEKVRSENKLKSSWAVYQALKQMKCEECNDN